LSRGMKWKNGTLILHSAKKIFGRMIDGRLRIRI
jgi:hypothetical protein